MAKQSKYEFDEWVSSVRPDPRNTEQITLLQGFLGPSSEEGHVRVYSDETLSNFVEIPDEAILYALKLTAEESPLGGSKLWIQSGAILTYGDPKAAARPKSTFLEGDIMQQYGAFGPAAGPGIQPQAASVPQLICAQPLTRQSVCIICFNTVNQIATCYRTICNQGTCLISACSPRVSCYRTICQNLTCVRTLCGPASCLPILCGVGGCGGISQINPESLACGPIGGPIGPAVQGAQPDTTQFGGYYGTFNPYMY
ncbi:hypothetical protein [Larkinella soli]|uniref:hypothetical protein n=1 Tax=Larkinella soli TaxID=1770527 RepID=UPI000FFBB2F2|nr:hypothetical protein [Larkinella soli]